jgi:hypothetical protein
MSLKIFNYIIGNRTRDLPVCSVVPYPLRHHDYTIERSYLKFGTLIFKNNLELSSTVTRKWKVQDNVFYRQRFG